MSVNHNNESPGSLAAFWMVVRQTKQLKSYVMIGAAAAPLVDLLTRIGPNWPNPYAIAIATVLAELVAYMVAYQLWHGMARARIERRWVVTLSVVPVIALVYFYLFSQYVYAPLGWQNRVIGASNAAILPMVSERMNERYLEGTSYDVEQALIDRGNDPDKIWQRDVLSRSRLALTAAWVSLFCAVALLFATFVILQMSGSRRQSNGHSNVVNPPAAAEPLSGSMSNHA